MGGGPLWCGDEANLVQQAFLAVRQRNNAPAHNKLFRCAARTTLFPQFTTIVVLNEHMTNDDYIPWAKELHS